MTEEKIEIVVSGKTRARTPAAEISIFNAFLSETNPLYAEPTSKIKSRL